MRTSRPVQNLEYQSGRCSPPSTCLRARECWWSRGISALSSTCARATRPTSGPSSRAGSWLGLSPIRKPPRSPRLPCRRRPACFTGQSRSHRLPPPPPPKLPPSRPPPAFQAYRMMLRPCSCSSLTRFLSARPGCGLRRSPRPSFPREYPLPSPSNPA